MGSLVVIAVGGALGALLRFLMANGVVLVWGSAFPYGTLAVNLVGSFLMGVLSEALLVHRVAFAGEFHAAILVGFLGSLTTFSTFSLDILQLLEQGQILKAAYYILSSVFGCLLAVWLGMMIVKSLFLKASGVIRWRTYVFPFALITIIFAIAFLFGFMARLLNAEAILGQNYSIVMLVIGLGTFTTVSALYLILNILDHHPEAKLKMPLLLGLFLGNALLCLGAVSMGFGVGKWL